MRYPASTRISREELAVIEKAVQYIKDHYPEKISDRDLAEEFGMTPRKIQAGFKRRTGFTVYKYQLFLKLEMAKALLRNPSYTIKQIAKETGFSNQNRFGELFKELTGSTPTEYRLSRDGYKKTPKIP